ncbi:hypothetical protein ACQ4PT_010904 [Festuca glaucescens]
MATPSSSSEGLPEQGGAADKLSALFTGATGFAVNNDTWFAEARIKAAFYPKFENENSDQETRHRMIDMVSRGLATMEVTLKHSGSLFMYAGQHGGAFSKNSFGNMESSFSFFAAYDALCEEGTATPVRKALDEVADISVPGSKDHAIAQGEILEGLVARMVSRESSVQMEEVLRNFSQTPLDGVDCDLGPTLREICVPYRLDEMQQIKAILENVGSSMYPDHFDWSGNGGLDAQSRKAGESGVAEFLQAHPTDYATKKLQETIRLMKEMKPSCFPAAFKCYGNYQKVNSLSNDKHYKMVIHVHDDSVFTRYRQAMKKNQGLWPLYRGFFIDVNLFKANNKKATELSKDSNILLNSIEGSLDSTSSAKDGLADEDSNLMIKLKFLPYKIRTFLIRNGLSTIFKDKRSDYSNYYVRATYIRGKYDNESLSSSIYVTVGNLERKYLSEAEPFLEQHAKSSPANLALVRAAGDMVQTEKFLAILDAQRDKEDDFQPECGAAPSSPTASLDVVSKTEGLIVFFPGIPGCAKSALCNEILKMPGGLGDNRPLHSLEGDRTKGTDINPFSLEALAVFMFRVLKRVNHPGNLGKDSPNAGNVLLKFYKLYDGKSRREFENELYERFGSLVKMPLLKPDRAPLPGDVKSILDEGLGLFSLHGSKRGRGKPSNGSDVSEEWKQWEERLREILFGYEDYLKSIQVPFDVAVKEVVEQLKAVAKGDIKTPDTAKQRFGNIIFAAVKLSQADILGLLRKVAEKDTDISNFLNGIKLENNLNKVHITLAHKGAHGLAAVASYSVYQNQELPVSFNALFYNNKMAALEAQLGTVNGETIVSRNDWPHCTLWTAAGVGPKKANTLPQLVLEGKAKRVPIGPPITISGVLDFY